MGNHTTSNKTTNFIGTIDTSQNKCLNPQNLKTIDHTNSVSQALNHGAIKLSKLFDEATPGIKQLFESLFNNRQVKLLT